MKELRDEEDLQNLFEGLALAERFGFYLLIAPDAETTRAILPILPSEVAKRHGQQIRPAVIDPYQDLPADVSLQDGLLALVLWRLTHVQREAITDPGERALWIVNGSAASAKDEEAWRFLFERMNERRNEIRDALHGPLLLCLPEPYYRLFAEAAPDFWSIRSSVTFVPKGRFAAPPAAPPPARARPAQLVLFYAPQDERFARELELHLSYLRRQGHVEVWTPRALTAGEHLETAIADHLATADVILLLVSSDFLVSDEMEAITQRALSLGRRGARVIPVRLRPFHDRSTPFASIRSLPRRMESITEARDRDSAWADVVRGIRDVLAERRKEPAQPGTILNRRDILEALRELMPTSFEALLDHLAVPQHVRPSPWAPRLTRAVDLLDYMESTGPDGLARLEEALGSLPAIKGI